MSLRRPPAPFNVVASLGLAALASLTGCLPGLTLAPVRWTSGQPSNVAVYLRVDTNDGKPVPNLTADRFTIFEDGSMLSGTTSQLTLVNPKVASGRYTLLLVDMRGRTVGTREVGEIIRAASEFADRSENAQALAVYAFDGSPDLSPVVPFTTATSTPPEGPERLTSFKPKDPTASLNGAVVQGLKLLQKTLAADPKPVTLGTLVVFTDGTDHATRVSQDDLHAAFAAPENARIDVFAVGVGANVEPFGLGEIGKSGTVTELDPANIAKAFDAVAAKIDAAAARFYLVSYCTPARAGVHDVRIQARSPDGLMGDLTYKFNADGFGPGCDPSAPPGYDLARPPDASSPPTSPPAEAKKKEPPKKAARKPRPTTPPDGASAPPAPAPAPPPAADPFAP